MSADTPLLVFAAAGQDGREFVALAAARGVPAVGVTRAEADIADAETAAALIARHQPRLVVNAVAYTAVDKAEGKPDAAARGNVEGPHVLAEAAAAAGVPILPFVLFQFLQDELGIDNCSTRDQGRHPTAGRHGVDSPRTVKPAANIT